MSLTVAALTFGIIFLSELPDKTALASLVLGMVGPVMGAGEAMLGGIAELR